MEKDKDALIKRLKQINRSLANRIRQLESTTPINQDIREDILVEMASKLNADDLKSIIEQRVYNNVNY